MRISAHGLTKLERGRLQAYGNLYTVSASRMVDVLACAMDCRTSALALKN